MKESKIMKIMNADVGMPFSWIGKGLRWVGVGLLGFAIGGVSVGTLGYYTNIGEERKVSSNFMGSQDSAVYRKTLSGWGKVSGGEPFMGSFGLAMEDYERSALFGLIGGIVGVGGSFAIYNERRKK